MPEAFDHSKQTSGIRETVSNSKGSGNHLSQLSARLTELQKANEEIRAARRAALNLMEDAILSKEALRLNEERMRRQKEAFQSAINGAALHESLNTIAQLVIEEIGARTAFYIADSNGEYLNPVYGAGNMPDSYLQQAGRFVFADNSPRLDFAIAAGEPVVIADVFEEPSWKPWLSLAEKFSFRSCWSFPIKTKDNEVIGAFAMFFSEANNATENEIALAEIVTQTASVIISNHNEGQKRKVAEDALRKSEQTYRTLFNSIDEGFYIIELIPDNTGKTIDFRYLETNQSFERHTGLKEAAGKLASEITPNTEDYWLKAYEKVAQSGEPERIEDYSGLTRRWYSAYIFRVSNENSAQVAVLFSNITERKSREERQKYLLKLSDALRSLADPLDIQAVSADLLGEHLNVNQAHYAETIGDYFHIHHSYGNGLPPMTGKFRSLDFGQRLTEGYRAGKVQVCHDTTTNPAISKAERDVLQSAQIGAYIALPLVKNGNWVATLSVHSIEPRQWKQYEIELVEATAERTWAAVERARAEEALRLSEARLKTTVDSATDFAIITTNAEGLIEGWSCGAEKIFGYTEKEVLGKSTDFIFTEEDKAAGVPQKEMQAALENGKAIDERWHVRRNGSLLFLSGVMSPISRNNADSSFVKVARDITEQRSEQEKIRVLEERYRIALQSAGMGAWDWNVADDIVIWNEQHYFLFGLQPDNKHHDSSFFLQFVHPDDKEKIAKALQTAVEETGLYEAEFRIQRADNAQTCWMNGFGRVIAKEGNRALRMVGVMFDTTERKQLEQQKEDFIGIASHELKTPVTSIKAYAELLGEMLQEAHDKTSTKLVHKLGAQVDRMVELIKSLLETARISEGKLELRKESFDLNKLITECMEDMQRITTSHRIHYIQCEDANVVADQERINQVLINLISNAVKYSPKGGEITIGCRATDHTMQISVHDNGIGISKEGQQKIFERFFREKSAKANSYPGLGLGLYITASIVKQHGGNIWVESEPGQGSTFFFTLPKQNNDREKENTIDADVEIVP